MPDQLTVYQRHYRKHRERRIAESKERAKRNRAIIDEFKSAPCVRCKRSYPTCVMDLHHIEEGMDPSIKARSVGTMTTYAVARLRSELDKCCVMCANCHRLEHRHDFEDVPI